MAICVSDQNFQQISFVNGIATPKGGTHVDYVVDMVVKMLGESTNQVLAEQTKNHMWIFLSCHIDNPTFDSQSNKALTLEPNRFDSECELSEKFKAGIVESVLLLRLSLSLKSRVEKKLKEAPEEEKTPKLTGIPKLDDAREAGTKRGVGCTLILTEGDSAKAFAVCGLTVLGRDYYGVYPLKGKLLNVREASAKQIKEDKQISDLIKILGLQFEKKYAMDDLRTLRYGKVMMVTDQDQDGHHIKGLVINFIHHNWPGLLKLSFLGEFIFPTIKEVSISCEPKTRDRKLRKPLPGDKRPEVIGVLLSVRVQQVEGGN